MKKGIKVRARKTVRYTMGQVPSTDKIRRNEVLVVESVNEAKGTLTFDVVPDRYGPFYIEDFAVVKLKKK